MTPERKARRAAQAKERKASMTIDQRKLDLERRASRARELYAINPHARRAGNSRSNIKTKYGITLEQKSELLAAQNYRCAICQTYDPPTASGWHVDHCHSTRVIRGILCQHCNNMLGMAKDNIAILKNAIKYLGEHQ